MEERRENRLNTWIDKSGNSDVDLVVNIETKPIAYSILCGLYAKGEINEIELEKAIQKLDSLIERDKRKQRENNYFNEEDNSNRAIRQPISRRRWF